MEKNYEAALKVIEGAKGICRENKDFAADIVRALAGEVKPEEMMFRVGDIVTHPIFGQGAIIEINSPNAIGDTITVEYFKGIGYHDAHGKGEGGHCYYHCCDAEDFPKLIHRPSLNISPKA